MLDLLNRKTDLTPEKRVDILRRALHSVPYFTRLDFPLITSANKENQFSANVEVNSDFWLTELMGNFGEVFTATTTLFNLSMWTDVQRSLYGYYQQQLLPTGQILSEARFRTPTINQIFDDRQFEFEAIKILRNNRVYAQIKNIDAKTGNANAIIVLKGFYTLPDAPLTNEFEMAEINASLDKESDFQYFKVPIDKQGFTVYHIENDRVPRLILGWGITNSTADKADVSNITVKIKDSARMLSLMDLPIPIDFLAPRLTCLLDQYLYYLPVEYYLAPFARINFEVTNTSPDAENPATANLAILTRTV